MTRILNRQRQLAEQGRLRLGYTTEATNGKTRPVRSETWILTSHSREHIEHAATLWGGEAHEWEPMGNGAKQWRVITTASAIPAILPPGDPLTQSYEMWSKGGCQRRCDGVTESFSGNPCICLAQHGDQWYELSAREVCVSKSRLKVLLPDMPGLGSWRMETGSFYATDEIAGMVDTIRGAVGESVLVPVTLRIEPRTRVAGGQTKQFVVPVVELRGVTAGALLSGSAVEAGALRAANLDSETPAALQAAPAPAEAARQEAPAQSATAPQVKIPTPEQVAAMDPETATKAIAYLEAHGAAEHPATAAVRARLASLSSSPAMHDGTGPSTAPVAAGEVVDAEIVEEPPGWNTTTAAAEADADVIWQQILKVGGQLGMTLPQIQDDCTGRLGGVSHFEATGAELQMYLNHLQATAAGEQVAS